MTSTEVHGSLSHKWLCGRTYLPRKHIEPSRLILRDQEAAVQLVIDLRVVENSQ